MCVCDGPALLVGNTPTGFMSEGNEQAPVPSGWWYDLSFCTSLLSAAALSHMPFQPGSEGDFLSCPPPPPPRTLSTFLSPFFNLRKSVWSPLLLTDVEFVSVSCRSSNVCLQKPLTCVSIRPFWKLCVKHLVFFSSHSKSHSAQTVINNPLTIHS